jgi:hypothetical protein
MATVDDLSPCRRTPRFVGIGESGLDYHYTADSAGVQQESLRIHIAAAPETGLPLIIHARDADEDMARILTEEYRAGRLHLRDALLFLRRGPGRAPRSTSASTCRCRASPPSRKATICAPSSPPRRSTASSWRPTAPISPRRPIAASATNRPTPPHRARRRRGLRRRGGRVRRRHHRQFRPPVHQGGRAARRRLSHGGTALHHPRLRVLGRRAAPRRPLGRLRPRQSEEPPPPLLPAGQRFEEGGDPRLDRHLARHARPASRRRGRRLDGGDLHP